ncbi:MAG: hypothetical protein IJV15_08475 [Lachnospiraceae bacterium]|nr:hypothetical protein [Lachnospiraceae bacterium]
MQSGNVNAKYIAKIGHRNELQNSYNVKRIAEAKKWEIFEQIKDDYAKDGADFDRKEVI